MENRKQRIAEFLDSLPMEVSLQNCESAVLSTSVESMGGTNGRFCVNASEVCVGNTNGLGCINYGSYCSGSNNNRECQQRDLSELNPSEKTCKYQ